MKIAKWGNSLAIRLPMALVRKMNLAEGDEVKVTSCGPTHIELTRLPSVEHVIEALRAFEGHMPAGYRFNRDEANER